MFALSVTAIIIGFLLVWLTIEVFGGDDDNDFNSGAAALV